MTSTSFPAILTTEKVPLVHLKTSGYISYYSDSGGVVAFDEPGLVGLDVYFVVESDGYVRQPLTPPSATTSSAPKLADTAGHCQRAPAAHTNPRSIGSLGAVPLI